MEKMEVLRQYFGFSSFREGQQTLIDAVLAGRDVLGVMPTGGGKSLCYELPALLLPGLTLVISPLISLMKDQVMALQNAGIPAGCIHSAMSVEELREAYRDTRFGAYKILYIAPERLLTDGFCALAQELEISLLAVDEAHCISQWGQDFRPSYLKILDFLQKLPRRPALAAFTATATAQVRSDIVRILQLQDPVTVVTGFDRPNLRFEVLRPQDKRRALLELLEERRDKSGIVYCATRKGVEQICELLQIANIGSMDDIQNLFKETIAEFMENGLETELYDELGYSKYDYRNKDTDNSHNGHSSKTLRTSFGDIDVSVPRDRKEEFESRC